MKFGRCKGRTVKEVLQIWRDPRSLMIALVYRSRRCLCSVTVSISTSSIFRSAPSTR